MSPAHPGQVPGAEPPSLGLGPGTRGGPFLQLSRELAPGCSWDSEGAASCDTLAPPSTECAWLLAPPLPRTPRCTWSGCTKHRPGCESSGAGRSGEAREGPQREPWHYQTLEHHPTLRLAGEEQCQPPCWAVAGIADRPSTLPSSPWAPSQAGPLPALPTALPALSHSPNRAGKPLHLWCGPCSA